MASMEPTNPKRDEHGQAQKSPKGETLAERDSRWKVRYRKPNGLAGARVFDTKSEAKAFAASVETDKGRGEFIDPRLRRVSFDEWAWRWWATTTKLAPQTRRGYWLMLQKHVVPYFGGQPLGSIDWADVEVFISHLRKTLGPKKTRDCVSVVSLVMKLAIASGARKDNPTLSHKIPGRKRTVRRQDMLRMEQIETFIDALSDHYRAAGWALVFTGYRPAELCGANVEDLDFLRRRIEVRETFQPVHKFGDDEHGGLQEYQLVTGPTKTEAGDRSIPLPAWLCDLIAGQLAERVTKLGRDLEAKEPLFVTVTGRRINRQVFRQGVVRPALRAAGLPEAFRTYDFRHNHASLLIDLGHDVLKIAKRLGHADPAVTLRVYGHLFEDAQEQVTNSLDELRDRTRATVAASHPRPEVVALDKRQRGVEPGR